MFFFNRFCMNAGRSFDFESNSVCTLRAAKPLKFGSLPNPSEKSRLYN